MLNRRFIMERIQLSALIFTLVISSVLVPESHAYCWQAGWNPGFKVSYNIPYKVSVMIQVSTAVCELSFLIYYMKDCLAVTK